LKVAVDVISEFLLKNDLLVYIVVFDKSAFQISEKLFSDIASYIDDKYVDARFDARRRQYEGQSCRMMPPVCNRAEDRVIAETEAMSVPLEEELENTVDLNLDEMIKQIDESFSQMLLRKIDEKGMKDSECYKKANIDRKLFSKIKSNVNYKPSKTTAIAFAIALELSLEETKDMLMKAGFALSHSNKFDIIIEFFITKKNYNIFEINEALFAFDQSLLGV